MSLKGHPITLSEINRANVDGNTDHLSPMLDGDTSILLIRDVFPIQQMERASKRLRAPAMKSTWTSPNKGMVGGEIKTVGAAATPTFTSFGGPSLSEYQKSVQDNDHHTSAIFEDCSPTSVVSQLFSDLFHGRPAAPATFDSGDSWLPYNYRSLDTGHQIYPHHDNHYRLKIYEHLADAYDRNVILSWFTLLQPATSGGCLIVYGLLGSDPNPPMLPTRFLDTDVLENEYIRCTVPMKAGDVVVFNSGAHVHRVSEVTSAQSRLTMGGFATVDQARRTLIFWS